MELFSLGADRGAYTEDDVREMARALTGWSAEWSAEARSAQLPLRPLQARRTARRPCSGRPATGTGKTPCASASSTRCTPRSSSPSCGATSSRPQPDEATLASLQGIYIASRLQHPRGRRGDPPAPRLLRRARAGDAAGRVQRRAAARDRALHRHHRLGVAVRGRRPAALLPAQRRRLGIHRWLDTSTIKARWEMANYVIANTYPNPWPREGEPEYDADRDPAEAMAERDGLLGQPAAVARIAAVHRRSSRSRPCPPKWPNGSRAPTGRSARTRCGMLIATSPDMQVS